MWNNERIPVHIKYWATELGFHLIKMSQDSTVLIDTQVEGEEALEYVSENLSELYPVDDEWVSGSQQVCVYEASELSDYN